MGSKIVSVGTLENEKANCGIRVYEVNIPMWCKVHDDLIINRRMMLYQTETAGVYFEIDEKAAKENSLPTKFILISKFLKTYEKITTLLHEIGHLECVQSNCKCDGNIIKQEVHADLHCLRQCDSKGYLDPMLHAMHSIISKAKECEIKEYQEAAQTVIQHKDWKTFSNCYAYDLLDWTNIHEPTLIPSTKSYLF